MRYYLLIFYAKGIKYWTILYAKSKYLVHTDIKIQKKLTYINHYSQGTYLQIRGVSTYHIRPYYRTVPYKHTVKQFRLQLVYFSVYMFIKEYPCRCNSNEYPKHMFY